MSLWVRDGWARRTLCTRGGGKGIPPPLVSFVLTACVREPLGYQRSPHQVVQVVRAACVSRMCWKLPIRTKLAAIRGVLPIHARDIDRHAGRQEVIRSDGRMRCSADERFLSDECCVTAMVARDRPYTRVRRSVLRQQGVQFAGTLFVKNSSTSYDCGACAPEGLWRGGWAWRRAPLSHTDSCEGHRQSQHGGRQEGQRCGSHGHAPCGLHTKPC